MGAQSDFLGQTFLPNPAYRAEQLRRAQTLLAHGIPAEDVAAMLSMPLELVTAAQQP